MIKFVALALLAITSSIAPAQAGGSDVTRPDVPWVLRKAIKDGSKFRYIGTRTIQFRKDGQSQKYSEIVTRDGPNMRIEFPSDAPYAGQVIVETATERRHFFPDTNEIHVFPPRREEAMSRLERLVKLSDRIRLSSADGESVAGLPTIQVIVRDKNDNIQQRLYITRAGMLLKRLFFDPVGTPVGGFEFQRIDLNPNIAPGMFKLERRGARIVRPLDQLRDTSTKAGFPFASLKEASGYSLMFSRISKVEGSDVVMQFYASEGKRLSLFQLRTSVSPSQLQHFARDLQVFTWSARGNTFILIGGQDVDALKKLSSFVTFGN